jgi:peptidoglycan/LPS O-acetylase OafA/YrhL
LVSARYIISVRYSFGILRFLGKISFSLYLMHVLFGTLIELVFVKILGIRSDGLVESICLVFIVANLSVMFSYCFYLCVERPLTLLSKKRLSPDA